jgi:hypothetical protein
MTDYYLFYCGARKVKSIEDALMGIPLSLSGDRLLSRAD